MCGKYFSFISSLFCLLACSSPVPDISVACERDEIGNYIIKWETNPVTEGVVRIDVSDNPEQFSKSNQSLYANISDGVATYITEDYSVRHYFRLSFNDKYNETVATRTLTLNTIHNFRDLGGYKTSEGKKTRWGKVYRSGDISHMSKGDSSRLNGLAIKTIIDLRNKEEVARSPIRYSNARIIHIPVEMEGTKEVEKRLQLNRMRTRDALLYMQDRYLHFVTDYDEEFTQAIHVFTDKSNYPILIHSDNGKDRTGFLSALLLSALDIPTETIIEDYTLSSQYINMQRVIPFARNLSAEGQEAMTILLSSTEELINPTLQKIAKDYGSIDNYLSGNMNLSTNERVIIKDILLY